MKNYTLIETCVDAEDKNTAVEKTENVLHGKPQGVEYEASVVLNADSKHKAYLQYLSRWIFEHYEDEFEGCSPAGYDEWLDNEYKEDDGDKKYNIYEYKNLTPKQLREIYRNITGLNNDEEFTNQEIVKYLLDALQESKKVDGNEYGPMEQIEKMAKERSEIKDIMKLLDKCVSLNPMCKSEVASVLYGNNYRKIPEDSVVLSMEEYKKLKGSYKVEKYYGNEDGPIDEEKAFIWKVVYGEYDLEDNGDIVLGNDAASAFNVGNLVKIVFEDEEDSFGIYRVVKVMNTYCVCEFIK